MSALLRGLPALVAAGCLLAGWEFYARASAVSPLILPPPSGVLSALWRESADILSHSRVTAQVMALGFSLSVLFACALSLLLWLSPLCGRALLPLMAASQTIPLVALAPLMILWFGFGLLPKVLLVILVTFFPILLSLSAGYRAVPQDHRDLFVSMGAARGAIYRRLIWPWARPQFFAGLKISATYAVVATIFAEYSGARAGLGIYLLSAKNNFRADLVLATVVVSALMTLTLLGLVLALERLSDPKCRRRRD